MDGINENEQQENSPYEQYDLDPAQGSKYRIPLS